jgi:outer membrane lipoprotein-sorting protein
MSRRLLAACFFVLGLLLASRTASADDARKLLVESEARHRTKTQQYAGELTVVSKDGKVRKKSWRSWRDGYAGDSKLLIRFAAPPEVKGVSFLSLGRPGKSPDQWLYLPSMKRERRIASQDRDTSFVGTDFNYEDMEEFDQSKLAVSIKGEETVDRQACWLIEARPEESSGKSLYEKKLLWLRKDILTLVRQDIFRNGEKVPAKRLTLSDIQQVEGHWVAKTMEMSDLKKGSKTTIVLEELAFDRPHTEGRFTLQNLNREGGED